LEKGWKKEKGHLIDSCKTDFSLERKKRVGRFADQTINVVVGPKVVGEDEDRAQWEGTGLPYLSLAGQM